MSLNLHVFHPYKVLALQAGRPISHPSLKALFSIDFNGTLPVPNLLAWIFKLQSIMDSVNDAN